MDLVTYLKRLARRPGSPTRHGDMAQLQPEEVRDVLRGARNPGRDRYEAEADRLAAFTSSDAPELQPVSGSASNSRGAPLAESQREHFESRFGVDLPSVRIHSGPGARKAADALGARAFTVGRDIVLGDPARASSRRERERLLTHEMVHVAQQHRGALPRTGKGERPRISPAPLSIQCDDGFGFSPSPGFTFRSRPWWEEPRGFGFGLQLQLDPELEAELMLMRIRMVQRLLEPDTVRESLFNIDPSVLGTGGTDWLSLPPLTEPAPLVTPGPGPEVPRPATGGDLFRAIMAVPAVDTALTNLRTSAVEHVRSDWNRLSNGERVLLVSQGVLLGGAALTAVMSNEETRSLVLDQLQGRDLPVPFVPGLSFQFNLTGPDQRIFFTLDVGRLVSP